MEIFLITLLFLVAAWLMWVWGMRLVHSSKDFRVGAMGVFIVGLGIASICLWLLIVVWLFFFSE